MALSYGLWFGRQTVTGALNGSAVISDQADHAGSTGMRTPAQILSTVRLNGMTWRQEIVQEDYIGDVYDIGQT